MAAYVLPVLGDLSVAAIDTPLVLKVVEPIWKAKPETAGRVRGRIETILDWAKARGYRQGDNPAAWRGHLDQLLPAKTKVRKVEHHAALPYGELAAFMTALRKMEGNSARALEFAILTAARTGEVLGAKWSEIGGNVWTVPADRMKAGREHRVALSVAAVALLAKLPREEGNNFIFIGGKTGQPLSNMAMLTTLRRMERGDLTAHGFRSTFRDWAGEQTAYPREVIEAALAHTLKDKTESAYARGDLFDKRAKLMQAWANYADMPLAVADNVAPMRAVS